MEIEQYYRENAKITKSKGFDTSSWVAQILLMATELGEALECLESWDAELENFRQMFVSLCWMVENARNQRQWNPQWELRDGYTVDKKHGVREELHDCMIRIFSFIGSEFSNIDECVEELRAKMEYNAKRPQLHGKKN